MIHQWKRALLEGASGTFERGGRKKPEQKLEKSSFRWPALGSRAEGRKL